MIQQMVRICEFVEHFLWKTFRFFPENFLDFRFDTFEKQSIMNGSSFSSKSYVSIVFSDSEVIFLGEELNATFCPFLICILFIDNTA